MTTVYTEADADLGTLEDRTIAIIGYDALGRAAALNLRDSGLLPLIGEANERRSAQAAEDGFQPLYPAEAAAAADIKLLLVSEEVLPEVYMAHISPALKPGDLLIVPSGYPLAYGFVEAPPFMDVGMIAPRLMGSDLRVQPPWETPLRASFQRVRSTLSFIAVAQDASGKAWPKLLAVARAMGALRGGAIELSPQQEAELDLFAQQTVLPMLHYLLITAAELLIREGYPPEAALLELYVSGELSDLLGKAARRGLMETLGQMSLTGQYGVLSRTERFQDAKIRRQMESVLDDIRSGKFAKEWASEYLNGYPRLNAFHTRRADLSLWEMEQAAIDLLRHLRRPADNNKPDVPDRDE